MKLVTNTTVMPHSVVVFVCVVVVVVVGVVIPFSFVVVIFVFLVCGCVAVTLIISNYCCFNFRHFQHEVVQMYLKRPRSTNI